ASYRAGSVAALGIARAPDAGEDLPPLRKIPVAEGGPGDERVGDPRAAAQHSVLVAEEGLRVLPIREGAEAGIAVEARRRPLPHRSARVLELVAGRLHRLLPLGLGGQALARPARVRLGLIEGGVLDRLARRPQAAADELR